MVSDLVESNGKAQVPATVMSESLKDAIMVRGDLSLLSKAEQTAYYQMVCDRVGLDVLTQPFDVIKFDGKTVLYAKKSCTDGLRKLYNVSTEVLSLEEDLDAKTVTARVRASMPDGRFDEDEGSVSLIYEGKATRWLEAKNEATGKMEKIKDLSLMIGNDRANAKMKAITKAKRRATLALCGLGFLDESEVETIDPARVIPDSPATLTQIEKLANMIDGTRIDLSTHLARYGAKTPGDLTERQINELISFVDKVKSVNVP